MKQLVLLTLIIITISYFFFNNQWDGYIILSKEKTQLAQSNHGDLLIIVSDSSVLYYDKDLELNRIEAVNLLESLTEVQLRILELSGVEQVNYIAAMYDISRDVAAPSWTSLDDEARSTYIRRSIEDIELVREQNRQLSLSEIRSSITTNTSIVLLDQITIDKFIEMFDIKDLYRFIYKANKVLSQYGLVNDAWVLANINNIEYITQGGLKIRFGLNSLILEQLSRLSGVLNYYQLESIKYLDISNQTITLVLK